MVWMGLQDCQNALIQDWKKSCQNDRFLIGFPQWFGCTWIHLDALALLALDCFGLFIQEMLMELRYSISYFVFVKQVKLWLQVVHYHV